MQELLLVWGGGAAGQPPRSPRLNGTRYQLAVASPIVDEMLSFVRSFVHPEATERTNEPRK